MCPRNNFASNHIDKFVVKCSCSLENESDLNSCGWTGPLSEWKTRECEFNFTDCPLYSVACCGSSCTGKVRRNQLVEHLAAEGGTVELVNKMVDKVRSLSAVTSSGAKRSLEPPAATPNKSPKRKYTKRTPWNNTTESSAATGPPSVSGISTRSTNRNPPLQNPVSAVSVPALVEIVPRPLPKIKFAEFNKFGGWVLFQFADSALQPEVKSRIGILQLFGTVRGSVEELNYDVNWNTLFFVPVKSVEKHDIVHGEWVLSTTHERPRVVLQRDILALGMDVLIKSECDFVAL